MGETTFESWEEKIKSQELRVREETQKLLQMHRDHSPRQIKDYTLQTPAGQKQLSAYFDKRNEILLMHNMGKSCVYCTLWADGYNGFNAHLQNRTVMLMVNDDDVATQTEFARSRGWTFPMASTKGTTLFADLGFHSAKDKKNWPGASVLTRDSKGQIWQKTRTMFGPGDLFCAQWNFVGILPSNVDWEPKYKY